MSRPIVKDSSNEKQVQRAVDYEKGIERGLEIILNTELPRRWLFDRLNTFAHPDMVSHVPGCSDSTAFNEGARSVGVAILREIRDTYPNQYLKMLEENLFET